MDIIGMSPLLFFEDNVDHRLSGWNCLEEYVICDM